MLRPSSKADPLLALIPKQENQRAPINRFEAFLTVINIGVGSGVTLGAQCYYKEGLVVGMVASVFFFMVYLLTSFYFTSLIINT